MYENMIWNLCVTLSSPSLCLVTTREGRTSSSESRMRETWVTWGAFDESLNKPVSMLTQLFLNILLLRSGSFQCFLIKTPQNFLVSLFSWRRFSGRLWTTVWQKCLKWHREQASPAMKRSWTCKIHNESKHIGIVCVVEAVLDRQWSWIKGFFYQWLAFYAEIKESTGLIISNLIVVFTVAVHVSLQPTERGSIILSTALFFPSEVAVLLLRCLVSLFTCRLH